MADSRAGGKGSGRSMLRNHVANFDFSSGTGSPGKATTPKKAPPS